MWNIEAHGFYRDAWDEKIKPLIDNVVRSLKLGEEAVTTFYPGSDVRSCNGANENKPFIRIVSTNGGEEETSRIRQSLAKAGLKVDFEEVSINKFIAAQFADSRFADL